MIDVLRSPAMAMALALILTVALGWETFRARWSPFFLIHAVLAIAFPLAAGVWPAGKPLAAMARVPGDWLPYALALFVWELGVAGIAFESWLGYRGKGKDPRYSPAAALDAVLLEAARRLRIGPVLAAALFAAYAALWAPFGEDLFFWGYLHVNLGPAWGTWASAAFTAILFGVHHVLYLGRAPGAGLPARLAFGLSSTVSGILMILLFRAAGSLYPAMAAHAAVNLAWIAFSALRENAKRQR